LPVTSFVIETKKEQKLKAESGTEIIVPADAFVDKSGKDIKGKVTLKYKEIKTPSDMIIENVDMTYDSAGVVYQFQTAGMFDLRAFSNGEEAFLKQGKNIKVSYVSEKKGNYNLYRYNKNWNYQGPTKGELPSNIPQNINTRTIGLKPVKVDPSNDLVLDIKANYAKIPELEKYKKIIWKYDGDLAKEEIVKILSSNIYNTELVATGVSGKYNYRFKSKSGNFEFPVVPVFSSKEYQKALNNYNNELAMNNAPVKVKRIVNVTELGLMNYDRIYHRSDAVMVKAEFKVNNSKIQGLPLFHITGDDDVVVRLDQQPSMLFSESLNNKIVAIMPGNKVAVLSTQDFIKSAKGAKKGEQLSFDLKLLDNQVVSSADLNEIISNL